MSSTSSRFTLTSWRARVSAVCIALAHAPREHRGTPQVMTVPEIICSGGAFAGIANEETSQGYLTPAQWRDAIQASVGDPETIVIDVRNSRETDLGK
jgi:predicted sulfurtransferase